MKSSLTPEVVQKLVQKGYVKPETAQKIKGYSQGGSPDININLGDLGKQEPNASIDPKLAAYQQEQQKPAAQPQSAPVQDPQQVDPAIQAKREMYNSLVNQTPGDPNSPWKNSMFGANGEAPQNFNPNAWNQAEQQYGQQQQSQAASFENQMAQTEKENEARRSAGLPALPAPAAPSSGAMQKLNGMKMAAMKEGQGQEFAPPLASDFQKQQSDQTNQFGQSLMQNIGRSYDAQEQAMARAANIGSAQASAEAGYLHKMAAENEKAIQTQELRRKEQQSILGDYRGKLDNMIQDYNTQKIDPKRFFNDQSTGQKIAMVFASALGGLSKDGNVALNMINKLVDNDIQAQRDEMTKKGNAIAQTRGVYADMMGQFKDEQTAMSATRLAYLDNAQLSLKEIASKYQNPMIQARAQEGLAMLEREKQKETLNFASAVQKSPYAMNADSTLRGLNRIPNDHDRETAVKELGDYKKAENTKQLIDDAMNTMYKNRLRSTPSQQQDYDTAKLALTSLTSEMFQGKSESEFDLVKSYGTPGWMTSEKNLQLKKDFAKKRFDTMHSFPVMEMYGLKPKTLDLKRN